MRCVVSAAAGLGLLFTPPALADVVLLGPGMDFPCVIESETDAEYRIRVPAGRARLPKASVRSIERATAEENTKLIASWEATARSPRGRASADAFANGVVVTAGDRDFERLVLESDKPVLVDFYADWCGPCIIQDPAVRQLAAEFSGRVRFVKVDTDRSPKMQRRFKVWALPTLVLFQDGEPVRRLRGLHGMSKIRTHLQQLVGDTDTAS